MSFDLDWFRTLLVAWMLPNTIAAGLLALVVAGLCRWRRFAPAVTHALWLIVLLKLVTPPLVEVPVPIAFLPASPAQDRAEGLRGDADGEPIKATFETLGSFDRQRSNAAEFVSTDPSDEAPSFLPDRTDEIATSNVPTAIAADAASSTAPDGGRQIASTARAGSDLGATLVALVRDGWTQISFPAWIAYVWCLGSLIALGIQLRRIVHLRQMIARALSPDPELAALVRRSAGELGVRSIPVHVVPQLSTPALCAWGGAALLWPEGVLDHLSPSGKRAVVLHELVHCKRRDHWVGWLELVAGCGWWWNPLYWQVRRQLRESAELACDAWVVALLPDGRRAYADALIDVAQGPALAPLSGIVLGVGDGSRKLLERRLIMIMRERMRYRIGAIGLTAIGLTALVTTIPRWSPVVLGAINDEPQGISVSAPYDASEATDEIAVDPQPQFDVAAAFQSADDVPAPAAVPALPAAPVIRAAPVAGVAPVAVAAPPAEAAPPVLAGGPQGLPAVAAVPVQAETGADARLQRLEAQLAALLAEVRNLRGPQGAAPRAVQRVVTEGADFKVLSDTIEARTVAAPQASYYPADAAPKVATPPAAPRAARSSLPAKPAAPKGVTAEPSVAPVASANYALNNLGPRSRGELGVDTVAIVRGTYKLPAGRAEAVARFLQEQLSDDIEIKVKGDSLQVTASAEDQQVVGRLLMLLLKKAKPQPQREGASAQDPFAGERPLFTSIRERVPARPIPEDSGDIVRSRRAFPAEPASEDELAEPGIGVRAVGR